MRFALQVMLFAAISVVGCTVLPRYTYTEEVRILPPVEADATSKDDLSRATTLVEKVAATHGMELYEGKFNALDVERATSSDTAPPRSFIFLFKEARVGGRLPVELRLEIDESGRGIYISITDFEQGSPSPTVETLSEALMNEIERTFPQSRIESKQIVGGPIFTPHP